MTDKKTLQLFMLTIAISVGYSRIYLGQHFWLDVIVGAVIGTGSGVFGFYLGINRKPVKIFNYNKNRQKKISKLPVHYEL